MDLVEAKTRFYSTPIPQIAAGGEGWSMKSIPTAHSVDLELEPNGGFGAAIRTVTFLARDISSLTGARVKTI